MKKAYDWVEWNFLFFALDQLGFHDKWIQFIKECITITSYTVNIMIKFVGLLSLQEGFDDVILHHLILLRESTGKSLLKLSSTKWCIM